MRFVVLMILCCLSVPVTYAINITQEGADTPYGFISWEKLSVLPQRVTELENKIFRMRALFVIAETIVIGRFIYLRWIRKPEQKT